MTTIRKAMLAPVLLLGMAAAGGAQAMTEASSPTYLPPGTGNVVGGGSATIVGGGDNLTVVYGGTGAGAGGMPRSQPPRLARLDNGLGTGTGVAYLEPPPAAPGREARLIGGGENASVQYLDGAATAPARRGR